MSGSTGIGGNSDINACLRKAACLILRVYDYSAGDIPASAGPLLRSAMQDWQELQRWRAGGYDARLYAPKGAEADPEAFCPPALVFRGTDDTTENRKGLGVSLVITQTMETIAPFMSRTGTPEVTDLAWSPSGAKTTGQLVAGGFREEPLREESIVIPLPSGGMASTFVNISARASLWTQGEGDWATNINQGLGQPTEQYNNAMNHARVAAEIALSRFAGRLMVLGHSLGGGLASAAATVAQRHYPALKVYARTFNAAGLNPTTVGQQGAKIGDVGINSYYVEHEILNTLQSKPDTMPLVASIFRWGNKRMPEAVTAISPRALPGGQVLWPLPEAEFPRMTLINNKARSSATIANFLRSLIVPASKEYIGAGFDSGELWNNVRPEVDGLIERGMKSVEYHLMPAVIHTFPERIGVS